MGRIKIALRANFGPLVCSFRLPALRSHKDSVLLKWCATLENMKFCKCIVALQSRWKKSESHREESSTCKELNRFRENLLSINYCDTRAKQSVMCPSVMTDQPLHPPPPIYPPVILMLCQRKQHVMIVRQKTPAWGKHQCQPNVTVLQPITVEWYALYLVQLFTKQIHTNKRTIAASRSHAFGLAKYQTNQFSQSSETQ